MEIMEMPALPVAVMDRVTAAPTVEDVQAPIRQAVNALIAWVLTCKTLTFFAFETQLVPNVLALGRLFIQLFLSMREAQFQAAHSQPEPGYTRQGPQVRWLGTLVGNVHYWRTYFYRNGGGDSPLDVELGLTGDGFRLGLQSYATRIATKVSDAQTVLLLRWFLHWSPAQERIESWVLGLGRHTAAWFESAPAPTGDGEVLVIQIERKATPTATQAEWEQRRGQRTANPHPGSQRPRGRAAPQRRGSQKRRKKGDKAKHGKMATIVVMDTLRSSADGTLEGPLHTKGYASYAPKRHAVALARREANQRGFGPESGTLLQIVTDGDNDLERSIDEFFPAAEHTIDVYHVIAYLWEAGECLSREGSPDLEEWVNRQKAALYEGRVGEVIAELEQRLRQLDPHPSSIRQRLEKVREYLAKRQAKMDDQRLREQDLEISSGTVEGAVRYVIAQRFDSGGMRWMKERAEGLLQLRCIEVNNDWDALMTFVHDKIRTQAQQKHQNLSLKCNKPAPLPTYGLA